MMGVTEVEDEEDQDPAVVLPLEVIQKGLKEAKRSHDILGPIAVTDINQRAITSDHHQIQAEYIPEILHGQEKNLEEKKEDLVQDLHLIVDHVEGQGQGQDHIKIKEDIQDLVLKVLVPDQELDVITKNQGPQA